MGGDCGTTTPAYDGSQREVLRRSTSVVACCAVSWVFSVSHTVSVAGTIFSAHGCDSLQHFSFFVFSTSASVRRCLMIGTVDESRACPMFWFRVLLRTANFVATSPSVAVIFGPSFGDLPEGWSQSCSGWAQHVPWVCLVPQAPTQAVTLNEAFRHACMEQNLP